MGGEYNPAGIQRVGSCFPAAAEQVKTKGPFGLWFSLLKQQENGIQRVGSATAALQHSRKTESKRDRFCNILDHNPVKSTFR
jgi:hypothetical protein